MMDKVLLIDAHNQLWRASIGFSPKPSIISNTPVHDEWTMVPEPALPAQEKKEANQQFVLIFNFFRNLRPIIEQFSPDKCYFVLEGHPKFRYDLFSDYKANRIIKNASKKDLMDRFHQSKEEVIRLIKLLPITIARAASYEADDTIAALCDNMKDESLTVLSSDSDYIQLLQKGYKDCKVFNPIKKEFMVAPEYPFLAFRCLAGDKSDNIPSLLKPKKVIEAVNNPEVFKKFMEIEENRANFNVNRQLIEFHSIPAEEIALYEGQRDFKTLKEEFIKMDFQSIVNEKSWEKYTKTFDCLRY